MKIFKIKTSFASPGARADKTSINFKVFMNIRGNLFEYDNIHDFSVWLITGSNPADFNRF